MNREAFVGRIRAALGRAAGAGLAPLPPVAPAELVAPTVAGATGDALVAHFVDRARAAGVHVHRSADEAAAVEVAAALLGSRSAVADASGLARRVVVAAGRGADTEAGGPRAESAAADLGADPALAEVGVTRAWRAVAETGTVVLRSEDGRSAGLLPPVHVVLLATTDLRPGLTEVYADAMADGDLPAALVQVTGPSRTADIEMTLVTRVHGPGEVHVVLIG